MRSVSLSPWYFIPFLLNSTSSSLMILCCFFMKSMISQWRCQNCFLNFCLVDRCWEFILPLIFFNMIFFLYSVINVTSTMLGFFSPLFSLPQPRQDSIKFWVNELYVVLLVFYLGHCLFLFSGLHNSPVGEWVLPNSQSHLEFPGDFHWIQLYFPQLVAPKLMGCFCDHCMYNYQDCYTCTPS